MKAENLAWGKVIGRRDGKNSFNQRSPGRTTLESKDLCLQTYSEFMAESANLLYLFQPRKDFAGEAKEWS